ncbi:MAG TPA: GntR family transcriptional regulator [Solirubrobacteraceae bacterium]|nr:GntR family transcriptional regulator [Solirubrobacteraceae bacterium]
MRNAEENGLAGMSVVRSDPVRLQVAAKIREGITELRFRPGQLLIERELCEATGASRASVREALRQLESEGLVHSVPGKGTSVAGVSRQEAIDLYEVRATLESMAGRLFAQRASAEQREQLMECVERLKRNTDETARFMAIKDEFYAVLFAGAGNSELLRIVQTLHRRITVLRATSLSVPGRLGVSTEELERAAKAACDGDAETAARRLVEHVEAAADAAFSVRDEADAAPA